MARTKKLDKIDPSFAVRQAGGPSALARLLSEWGEPVSSQAISQWQQVPAERVLHVERASGIQRHLLRPDIYPAPKPRKPRLTEGKADAHD